MASTYSDLKIELIGTGEQTGTWGTTTNDNFSIAIGEAITGSADVAFSSADVTVTLTNTNASQAARNLRLNLTGTSGGARQLILGSGCQIDKLYLINNGLADAVTVKNTSGTGIAVPAGKTMFVYNNGTNVVDAITYLSAIGTGVFDAGTVSAPSITFTGDTNTGIYSPAADTIGFTEGGVEGLRINSNGQTSTSIAGTASLPSFTRTGDENTGIFFPAADTIAFTEGGVESMRIDSGGNVLVGTATASYNEAGRGLIEINGSSTSLLGFKTGGTNRGYVLNDGTDMSVFNSMNGYLRFGSNNTERMRIDSSGNVGIGTTSINARLSVSDSTQSNGTIRLGNNGTFYGEIGYIFNTGELRINQAGSASLGTTFYTNGTERMRITSAGDVFVGSSSAVWNEKISVQGLGTTQLGIGVYSSSGSYTGSMVRVQAENSTGANWNMYEGRGAGGTALYYVNGAGSGYFAGNVGIGTSSPGSTLVVSAAGAGTKGGEVFIRNSSPRQNGNFAQLAFVPNDDYGTGGSVSGAFIRGIDTAGSVDNPCALAFGTGSGGTPAERMRITAGGDVGIGTSSPSGKLGIGFDNATIRIGHVVSDDRNINLRVNTGYNASITFTEEAVSDRWSIGTKSGIDPFIFATGNSLAGGTERMRLTGSGELLVGTTDVSTNTGAGVKIVASGYVAAVRTSAPSGFFNRLTDDGQLVVFKQDGTDEGNISVSGTTVSYNGGHLSRWSQLPDGSKDESIVKGTVMSNLDDMCVWEKDGVVAENEQLNKMKVSDVEGDTNVAGVFVNWTIDEQYGVDDMNVAMTGDMIIRIANGVVVQKGDLLMSAGDGTAKPQGDDIVRSKTVAKVTSNHVTCTYADGSYCVPCVLMAC